MTVAKLNPAQTGPITVARATAGQPGSGAGGAAYLVSGPAGNAGGDALGYGAGGGGLLRDGGRKCSVWSWTALAYTRTA